MIRRIRLRALNLLSGVLTACSGGSYGAVILAVAHSRPAIACYCLTFGFALGLAYNRIDDLLEAAR